MWMIAAFCLLYPALAVAIENRPVVRVAVPIIPQLVKKEDDRPWHGPLIDVLYKIEKDVGVLFDLRMVPFKRAVVMTEEGDSDFGIFMESPERNKIALPVVKLGDAVFVLVSLKDKPIRSLTDLKNKSVARIQSGTEVRSLAAVEGLQYYYFSTHDDGIQLLRRGRVDALLTADFRVLDAIEQQKLTYSEIAPPIALETRGLWLYWSWNSKLDFDLVRKIKNDAKYELRALAPLQGLGELSRNIQ